MDIYVLMFLCSLNLFVLLFFNPFCPFVLLFFNPFVLFFRCFKGFKVDKVINDNSQFIIHNA